MTATSRLAEPRKRTALSLLTRIRGLRLTRVATVLGLSFLVSCGSSSSGCGALTKIKGGYDVNKRLDSAISLRLSKGLFDFLSAEGPALIGQYLPKDGVPIPSSCGGSTEICCGQTCKIIPEITALTFTPAPTTTMTITARAKLRTDPDFKVKIPVIGTCTLSLDTTRKGAADIGVALPMVNTVDADTKLTSINFDTSNIGILDFDSGDIDISGGLLCATANAFKSLFMNSITDAIKKTLATPLTGLFCQKCSTSDDCSSLADGGCAADKKVCMRKGACMQELGVEGRMDLSTGGPQLDIYAALGSYAAVEAAPTSGLSLGMLGGTSTPTPSDCVPLRPVPTPIGPLGKTDAYSGNTAPNGQPYHVGLGLSKLELDTLGHSFYETGSLCLSVGTQQVSLLSSGLLSVLVPSLAEITRDQNTTLAIVIRPQNPPTFVLGKGTFKTDGMGRKTIDDPLLRLQIKDLALDFYAYIDERMVRFMRHTADIDVPVGLDIDNMGQIVPLLGDLSTALSNVRVTDSALLAESPDQLKALLPSLLPTLLGQLSSGLKPIALPPILGINLTPVQFVATPDTAGNLAYLGLFLALQTTMPLQPGVLPVAASVPRVKTYADLVGLDVPSQKALRNGASVHATLQLGASRPDGGNAEWQYRVDSGLWRPFDDKNQVVVDDSTLRLAGSHSIDVRARISGSPYSLDANPARVTFNVAPAADSDPVNPAPTASGSTMNPSAQTAGCEMTAGRHNGLGAIALLVVGLLSLVGLRRRRPGRSTLLGVGVVGLLGAAGAGACSNNGMQGNGDPNMMMMPPAGPHPELNPIDEIGRYQSAAVAGDKIYISAYDTTNGDLAFTSVAFADAPTATLAWLPVDGLPTGPPTNMSSDAYRGGYDDPGDDIGRFTALAMTSRGTPIVAYQDVTNNGVKLAIKADQGDTWQTSTITNPSDASALGYFISMVLDSSDVPTVAYMAHGVRKGDGSFTAQLMVAKAGSATPTGTDGWTKTPIAEAAVSCGGLCATGEACVYADPMKADPLATVCKHTDNTCTPGCKTGTACLAAACVTALAAPAVDELDGTGLYATLVSSGGNVSLLFHDHNAGALKMASGSDWKVTTIDGGDGTVSAGHGIGAGISTDGTLHIAYGDATHRVLYRNIKAGMPSAVEVVDDGSRMVSGAAETHWVGGGLTLFLDSDQPVVAYQDQTAGSLEASRRSGTSWTHGTVSPGGDKSRGFYPQAVSKDGMWLVLDVAYDRSATALSTTGFSPL